MLKQAQQNNGWEAKYQAAVKDQDDHEIEWQEIEALLRKTISRLSTATRGVDTRLDKSLRLIQEISREKRDEKLEQALEKLSQVVLSLEQPSTFAKQRRSDSIVLMLDLLQGINFDADQRQHLKEICSKLLKSVANGQDRDEIYSHVSDLSGLINENFGSTNYTLESSEVIYRLIKLLDLDELQKDHLRQQFPDSGEFQAHELQLLADLINAQMGECSQDSSIDSVITTLLERLAIVQDATGNVEEIQARVQEGVEQGQWADTLNDIVGSVSTTLKKLNAEKRELETFIINVTNQLGDITEAITLDHKDHQSDHEDTQMLHEFVEEGMTLMQKDFHSSTDLSELKSVIEKNIDSIRGGVTTFISRINERHEATEQRNIKLSEQLSQMEQETQELQIALIENREKLLYDSLTGVHSRLAYDEQIEQELARWNRHQTPFSYAIIDIDYFKSVNDMFGHNAGDKALKVIAQLMLKNVRKSDYGYRIGGEEFVLILTNTDVKQADGMIEKLRHSISASNFHFNQKQISLTVSAGLTETRQDDTVESIFERADKALYQAKNSGRNCQFVAD